VTASPRARADPAAGLEIRLVHGDITALREADVGTGFRLVLDTGTFTASPTPSKRRWAAK
jgi:hypothetical protein